MRFLSSPMPIGPDTAIEVRHPPFPPSNRISITRTSARDDVGRAQRDGRFGMGATLFPDS